MITNLEEFYKLRKSNALHLVSVAGSFANFAKKVGISRPHVSNVMGVNSRKNIGNKLAFKIEKGFNLPFGSLDSDLKNREITL